MGDHPTRLGQHELSIQDDELFIRFIGSYSPAEARQVLELIGKILAAHGRIFFIIDGTSSEMPGPETRRVLTDEFPRHPRLYTILVKTTLLGRTVMRIIEAAQRVAGKRMTTSLYFDSLAEARAFIAEERKKLQPDGD